MPDKFELNSGLLLRVRDSTPPLHAALESGSPDAVHPNLNEEIIR